MEEERVFIPSTRSIIHPCPTEREKHETKEYPCGPSAGALSLLRQIGRKQTVGYLYYAVFFSHGSLCRFVFLFVFLPPPPPFVVTVLIIVLLLLFDRLFKKFIFNLGD